MKATINGKRYNSETCEVLARRDHYNESNNYSGWTRLLLAADGSYLLHTSSNGQDLWLQDELRLCWASEYDSIDDFYLTAEQEERLVELGLIEIV